MEIVCVLGSPRPKGNSTTIAKRFCEKAEELGATVRAYTLNELDYKGCQGCMSCKERTDRCVLKDDLTEILNGIMEKDMLVLATPVYFGSVSGQVKTFIDRTFSFMVPDFRTNPNPSRLAPGKKAVFISAQGGPEDMFTDIQTRYENYFKRYGFAESHFIRGCGIRELGDIEDRDDLLEQAEKMAGELVG